LVRNMISQTGPDRIRLLVLFLLWAGFGLLFGDSEKNKGFRKLYTFTRSSMEKAARSRLLAGRKNLRIFHEKEGFWFWLEHQICYSGLQRRYPLLNAESFVLINILGSSGLFMIMVLVVGMLPALCTVVILWGSEWIVIAICKARQMRAVNNDLMKLLDFLGNYSVTSRDVIGIFAQIGKYLNEPLKGALQNCVVEAGTTGDVGLALLSMADAIEHPQFKDLVRNIEVSMRYSADFSALVSFSRRGMLEYLRNNRERKSLLREALINLLLLLGLSFFSLVIVDGLLEISIWTVLIKTLPGKIALGVVGTIIWLFACQIYRLEG